MFTGLDFDGLNLDFLLMTNELSALNDLPRYSFTPNANQEKYYRYRHNTLGYLQQKIKEESNGKLDSIRPIIVDGKPQYVFIDSSEVSNQVTMPLSHLYQPVIVNSDRTKNQEAEIAIDIECAYAPNTQGIDAYQNLVPEEKKLYASKIPLSNIAFAYTIKTVEIELVEKTIAGPKVILGPNIIAKDDYDIELGSLYVKEAIDSVFFPSLSAFNFLVTEGEINPSSNIYYRLIVTFDLVVEDSGSSEHNRMALSQATSYAVMDYFNQYTYASVTANMIGEIAYTETLTLISTLISTPLTILGSWSIMGTQQFITQMGVQGVKSTLLMGLIIAGKIVLKTIIGAVKETFEEIIKDGFIETWAERQVELWGGSEDMGFWFSALCTSGRETISGSAKGIRSMMKTTSNQQATITTALRNSDNLNAWVSQNMAKGYMSDSKARKAIMQQIGYLQEALGETDILLKTQKADSKLKIISSGIVTAFKFTMTSMFLGSQTMTAMLSLSGYTSTIKGISAKAYGRYKTNLRNSKVKKSLAQKDLLKSVKSEIESKKSDIDQEVVADAFAEQTGEQMPSTNSKIQAPGFVKDGRPSKIEKKLGIPLSSNVLPSSSTRKGVDITTTKDKQETLDMFTQSSIIKEKVQESRGSKTSSSQQVHLPQTTNTIKSQIYRWKNTQTGKDLTLNDKTITEASEMAGELFGMDRKEKIVFKIFDQIIAPDTTIENSEGKKLPIKKDTEFSVILDFLGYTSLNDGEIFASENQIIVAYESFSDLSKVSESYEGFGHIFKSFNYYFKNALDQIVFGETDAELFNKVNDVIEPIIKTLLPRLAPNIKAMTKNHFKDSFDNPFTGDVKMKFDSFVDSLYDAIIKPGFGNREKILEVLEDRLYFVALDSLMRECGIDDKSISVETLKANIQDFVNDPNKILKMYMDFFSTNYGKDKFINFFVDTFLASTLVDSVSVPRQASSYFGFSKEREFLLDIFPKRAIEWFNLILSKLGKNEEIPTITVNTKIIYSPDKTNPDNNLGGLDYSGTNFYGRNSFRSVDPPGSIDFGHFVVSSHSKSTRYDSITNDKRFQLVDGISNDGISIMIDDIIERVIKGEYKLLNLPPKIVELITTFAVLEEGDRFLNPQTKANAETILERFFSKEGINSLGSKLAGHEVLLINLVNLINSELSEYKTVSTSANIKNRISTIFKSETFQENVLIEAYKAFGHKTYFTNQLLTGKGFTDLKNFILKPSNFDKLLVDRGGQARLSFLINYAPHFKTQDDISVNDFKSGTVFIASENQNQLVVTEARTDNNLKTDQPLYVCHSLEKKYDGAVILVPLDLLRKIKGATIHEGFRDENGEIFTNIYVSDENNKKLNSKLKFTSDGYEIRKSNKYRPRSNWASQYYETSELSQDSEIIGFKSEFLAAYTFVMGSNIISVLQDTTAELIHIDKYKDPLPNIGAREDKSATPEEPEIFPIFDLQDFVEDKLELFVNFIDQITRRQGASLIRVSSSVLGLDNEKRVLESGAVKYYSYQYYEEVFSVLDPESSSIPNAMENIRNFYLDADNNPIAESTSQFLFYDTMLKLIQDKIGNDLFKEFEKILFDEGLPKAFTQLDKFDTDADFDLVKDVDKILTTIFSFNGLLLIKAGLMTIERSSAGYKIDFSTHTFSTLAKFLGKFNIWPLFGRKITSVAINKDYLKSWFGAYPKSLWVYSSLFLFGYRQYVKVGDTFRDMYVAPVRSFATELFESYPNKRMSRLWFNEISEVFLDSHYSELITGHSQRTAPNVKSVLNAKQTLFDGVMNMITNTLMNMPMPSRTGDIGTDANKRKAAEIFLASKFIRSFYALKRTTGESPQYMDQIKNMFYKGVSGELIFGRQDYNNPLFKIDPQDTSSGFQFNFNFNEYSSEELQSLTWAIKYYNDMSSDGEVRKDYNKIIQLSNIAETIKNPIVASYNRLYNIFANFKDDNGEFVKKISIIFYYPHTSGNDGERSLKLGIGSSAGEGVKTGNTLEIIVQRDASGKISNLETFNEGVLSIIHYLAKYPYSYFAAKYDYGSKNMLYASLTEIFSEEFIKTRFKEGHEIAGSLSSFARDNYEKWQNGYFDEQGVYHFGWNQDLELWASGRKLWSRKNIFPIFLFKGANSPTFGKEDFAKFLVDFFASLSGDKSGRYNGIKKILKLS